jgi:hypothetical protein
MIPPDVRFKPFTALWEVKRFRADEAHTATSMSPSIRPERVRAAARAMSVRVRLLRSRIVGRKAI